ncbi:MAG: phosphoribosylamine--glycine ligase [Kiritimatiellia bacterium]|nr:phosphoribosylamine--glycine ligase [Kiritimatiellia bacterium]
MKTLIIGGGGREHTLCWKIARDNPRANIFTAPGNAGTAGLGTNLLIQAEDIAGILNWAKKEKPDLTVVGPEAPLCSGITDLMQTEGFRVFGPTKDGAKLEGSKIFAKEILRTANVATAESESFAEESKALAYIKSRPLPLVVKADGLAAGKGVMICATLPEAEQAIHQTLAAKIFGKAGQQIIIEECLAGEEVSVLAFVDGNQAVLLPTARDHKRVFDNDKGPNTGGMGAYSPAPIEGKAFAETALKTIFEPTIKELKRRGICYKGVLYAGLMLTAKGPKVLEFNCRFGDPETQAILPRLKGSLVSAMEACVDGNLRPEHAVGRPENCACVVMTAGGYPGSYQKGDVISGLDEAAQLKDVMIFHAGTKLEQEKVVTAGGRVLGVTALGNDLASAVKKAYQAAAMIKFNNAHYRRDIASSGIKQQNKVP